MEFDLNELREYVKSKTTSNNLSIKSRATLLLGLAGYDEDIPFLSSIVKNEQKGFAEQAALSLTYIHSKSAVEELRVLNNVITRPSLKSFLQNLVSQYQSLGLIDCKKIPKEW